MPVASSADALVIPKETVSTARWRCRVALSVAVLATSVAAEQYVSVGNMGDSTSSRNCGKCSCSRVLVILVDFDCLSLHSLNQEGRVQMPTYLLCLSVP